MALSKLRRDRAKRARYKAKVRAWVDGYIAASKCADCGLSGWEWADVMEFHHLSPETKENNIKRMIGQGCSIAHIRREIQGTVVVCKDCHDKRHAEMGVERVMRGHAAEGEKGAA